MVTTPNLDLEDLMHRDLDWAAEVERLRAADAFRDGLYRKVAAWLDPPPGATVLDAGCGAGGMTARLAEAVGPGGRVVALDAEPAAVAATGELVAARGLAGRVEVTAGELPGAVAGHGPFDLIWASHVVHHLPDEAAAVRALVGRLRPGGRLALAEGGLPMRCLPVDVGLGRSGLESRLEAAAARWFAGLRAGLAGSVPRPHGWPRLLAEAGLVGVGTRSFLLELGPPLTPGQAAYVRDHLQGWLDRLEADLDQDDREVLGRLTDPDGPHDIARRDDVFALAVDSVQLGTRPPA